MTRRLGIDPGNRGAAAIVEGDDLLWLASWRKCTRGYRVWVGLPPTVAITGTLAGVGRIIAEAASEYVIDIGGCEGQSIPKGRGVQSILTLARGAGEVSAYTRDENRHIPWEWPTSRQWRPRVGIPPATPSKDAKRWAADIVRTRSGVALGPDEAEAVCIAWALEDGA